MLEYSDFYDIATYGNQIWKGSFTQKEIASNAYDYTVEYQTSMKQKTPTNTMIELYKLIVEDWKNSGIIDRLDLEYWIEELERIPGLSDYWEE